MEQGLGDAHSACIFWYLPLLHPRERRWEGGSCPEVRRCLWGQGRLLLFRAQPPARRQSNRTWSSRLPGDRDLMTGLGPGERGSHLRTNQAVGPPEGVASVSDQGSDLLQMAEKSELHLHCRVSQHSLCSFPPGLHLR